MNFSEKLAHESELWVSGGLITQDQRDAILAKYPLEVVWYRQSNFLLRALALALLGGALILVISANWDVLPRFVRSLFGLVPLVLAHIAAVHYYRKNNQSFTDLALFFAGIALGANIFLQAQIYHIDSYFPNGFLWWMVGLLPALILTRNRIIAYTLLVIFMAHGLMLFNFNDYSGVTLVFLLAAGWLLWLKPSVPLSILWLIAFWQATIHLSYYENKHTAWFILIVLFTLLAQGYFRLLGHRMSNRRAASILAGFASWGFIFLWYLTTYIDFKRVALEGKLTFTLAALAMVISLLHAATPSRANYRRLVSYGFVGLLVLFQLFFRMDDARSTVSTLFVVFSNLAFLGSAIYFIWVGLLNKIKAEFFTGVAMIVALAFGRYIDLVGDYITSALLFALCGLTIWLLNRYWEQKYAS